jgi:hypothetical protein
MSRQRLEKYPDDFNATYNIGDILLNRGKAVDAIPYFQAAPKANRVSVTAATELGGSFHRVAARRGRGSSSARSRSKRPTATRASTWAAWQRRRTVGEGRRRVPIES